MKRRFSHAPVIAVGVALVAPVLLIGSALLFVESRIAMPATANPGNGAQPAPGAYAQTFAMTIFEEARTVRLWLKDVDTAPYFRQTIEVDGQTVSDQLYRFDERTLYTGERSADGALTWSSVSDLDPADLQLASLTTGPGAWAEQYGPGEQEIPLAQGTIRVTIESVGEIADSAVFELPEGANPIPADG